ncbi:MAG: TrpB-like pyridoxal phosphate-dependent enzyme [Melioribacteraceae bacterium]|nr:TrpB-like pyridoxal phosphate-dependent enzyme [Melioribacteraceae bacterium]
MSHRKFILDEKEIPEKWYNIQADMPNKPLPSLHPVTKQPIGPDDLAPLFPMELIKQEIAQERWIEIPEEVREVYKLWRPTPLFRATNLEKELDTPAKIYYKYEGVSPAGSHKPNTAVAQAYYNMKEGVRKLTTETGAGQWGSALAFACERFGIDLEVYMVRVSYEQKPYRKLLMNTWGAEVYSSPTDKTESGKAILAKSPNSPGSLGIAISEAVERAATSNGEKKYSLGSVLNHVLMHQTVIGLEAIKQMEKAGDYPDIVIAPLGGGSNFAGISFPFLNQKLTNGKDIRCIAVEPASCPKLTKGEFRYDFGDTVGLTPLLPMYTLGHTFVPESIHAGGLRYHGASVLVSQLLKDKLVEASAIHQLECFAAGVKFANTEGILPAPEATHGIAQVIREANKAKEEDKEKTILFNLCGHGYLDMSAYQDYFDGKLEDHELTHEELYAGLNELQTPRIER